MSQDNNKISCFINTFNSEDYLENCIKSALWCDEIIIIDMYSTDKTLEIAKKYDVTVYMHEQIGYVEPARVFALEKCKYPWILNLDSDEMIPKPLASELRDIANNDKFDAVKISFRFFMFGREIIGSGFGYETQVILRFFKRGKVTYNSVIHDGSKIAEDARVGEIISKEKSIIHYNYHSIQQYIQKLNNYTTHEAASAKEKYHGKPWRKMLYFILKEFTLRFILLKGYKDGWLGFYLAISMCFYKMTAVAKSNLPTKEEAIQIFNDRENKPEK